MTTQITFFISHKHFFGTKEEIFANRLDPRTFFHTHKEQESIYQNHPGYGLSLRNIAYLSLQTQEGVKFRSMHVPILCLSIYATHSCAPNCQNIHHLPVYWAWQEIIAEKAKQRVQKPIGPPAHVVIKRGLDTETPVGIQGLHPENDPIYDPKRVSTK